MLIIVEVVDLITNIKMVKGRELYLRLFCWDKGKSYCKKLGEMRTMEGKLNMSVKCKKEIASIVVKKRI